LNTYAPFMNSLKINLLLLVTAFTFIMVFQGSRGLWERDEGRYTDVAVEMLHKKDFIVPLLNDDISHFSKPPLTYWAIAAGIVLLGKNEWGVRLANGVAFAFTVFLIFLMAKKIYPENQLAPPLIYATSIFPFTAANFVTTDTLLTLWETLAVYGFVRCYHERTDQKDPWGIIIMWVGFGLAFLTKGPPGLLPLFAIIAFLLLSGEKDNFIKIFNPIGLMFFLVMGFSWYVVVILKNHDLIHYFIINEFIKRIATGTHHRNPEWYKPFIIYLPILVFGTLPWTYVFFKNIELSKYKLFRISWWKEYIKKEPWQCFLMLWIIIPLSIFFVAKSRLPLYILPLFVPISLFYAMLISLDLSSKKIKTYIIIWIIFLFTIKFIMAKIPYKMDSRTMAKYIKSTNKPLPKEVVFVDSVPFWGLSLYLDCEVEELTTNKDKADKKSEEYIIKELKEKENGVLYAVEKKKLNSVLLLFKKNHVELRKIGEYNFWVFFSPSVIQSKDHI